MASKDWTWLGRADLGGVWCVFDYSDPEIDHFASVASLMVNIKKRLSSQVGFKFSSESDLVFQSIISINFIREGSLSIYK